jgi:hypothetical protein
MQRSCSKTIRAIIFFLRYLRNLRANPPTTIIPATDNCYFAVNKNVV